MLPLPLEVRAALACGAVAVLLGGVAWWRHHERAAGAAELRAEVAQATIQAQAAALTEVQRRIDAAEGATNAADQAASAARAASVRARSDAERLLQRASSRACYPSADTPIASAGASAPAADVVPAELLRRTLAVATELGTAVDDAHIAGQACEWIYDSLNKKLPP